MLISLGGPFLGEKRMSHPRPEDLMELWNKCAGGDLPFSSACVLNDRREYNCGSRLKEIPSLDYWRCLFAALKYIPEFRGDNAKRFVVSFDWIIRNDTNHVVVFEGIKAYNKKALKDTFEYMLNKGELNYLKKYLQPGEELKNLPHFVLYVPQKQGEIDKECIEWAHEKLKNITKS